MRKVPATNSPRSRNRALAPPRPPEYFTLGFGAGGARRRSAPFVHPRQADPTKEKMYWTLQQIVADGAACQVGVSQHASVRVRPRNWNRPRRTRGRPGGGLNRAASHCTALNWVFFCEFNSLPYSNFRPVSVSSVRRRRPPAAATLSNDGVDQRAGARIFLASEIVYECPNEDACVGGLTVATSCSDGFKGPREWKQSVHGEVEITPSESQSRTGTSRPDSEHLLLRVVATSSSFFACIPSFKFQIPAGWGTAWIPSIRFAAHLRASTSCSAGRLGCRLRKRSEHAMVRKKAVSQTSWGRWGRDTHPRPACWRVRYSRLHYVPFSRHIVGTRCIIQPDVACLCLCRAVSVRGLRQRLLPERKLRVLGVLPRERCLRLAHHHVSIREDCVPGDLFFDGPTSRCLCPLAHAMVWSGCPRSSRRHARILR